MKYYKHRELVRNYSVSDRTVRNWVAAALQGKTDLKLYEEKGKYYVADSVANKTVLESLAQSGKKYRNSHSSKTVEPQSEFYELFAPYHVVDIVNTLEKKRELPWQYAYFGQAAEQWDEHSMELHSAGKGNLITDTIDTVRHHYPYLEALVEQYDHVNVINICVGNNIAIHDLLSRIKASGKLKRFIAADISSDMLDIAGRNIEKWFSGSVKMERCVLDIRNQPLNVLGSEHNSDGGRTINLFLMVAGPLKNFEHPRRVLETVNASMTKDDLLITTTGRDIPQVGDSFDLNVKSDKTSLDFGSSYLLNMLNIDRLYYEVEQAYDETHKYISVRFKVNLAIHFKISGVQRVVELEKGDSILLRAVFKHSDNEISSLLEGAGFDQLLVAQTINQQLLFTVSRPMKAPLRGGER